MGMPRGWMPDDLYIAAAGEKRICFFLCPDITAGNEGNLFTELPEKSFANVSREFIVVFHAKKSRTVTDGSERIFQMIPQTAPDKNHPVSPEMQIGEI